MHRFLHKIHRVDMERLFLSCNICVYIYIMYPPRFDGRAAVYFNPDQPGYFDIQYLNPFRRLPHWFAHPAQVKRGPQLHQLDLTM